MPFCWWRFQDLKTQSSKFKVQSCKLWTLNFETLRFGRFRSKFKVVKTCAATKLKVQSSKFKVPSCFNATLQLWNSEFKVQSSKLKIAPKSVPKTDLKVQSCESFTTLNFGTLNSADFRSKFSIGIGHLYFWSRSIYNSSYCWLAFLGDSFSL